MISFLTISQNIDNLKKLIDSIILNYNYIDEKFEIVISWNGKKNEITYIKSLYNNIEISVFYIPKYNFAKNNNFISKKAKYTYLCFVNDDVMFFERSISHGLNKIKKEEFGMVGGQLVYPSGKVQHIGVYFDSSGKSFHEGKNVLNLDENSATVSKIVPAITGALILIRKKEFFEIFFNEDFEICGEDLVLSLQYQVKYNRLVFYESEFKAYHFENLTRRKYNQRLTPPNDLKKVTKFYEESINIIKKKSPKVNIYTEKERWVSFRLSTELKKVCIEGSVSINPQNTHHSDIEYYIPYGYLHRHKNNLNNESVKITNFTHYNPNVLSDEFKFCLKHSNFITSISYNTTNILVNKFNVNPKLIKTIIDGSDENYKIKLILGVVGRSYPDGRKGEWLINKLLEDEEVKDFISIYSNNTDFKANIKYIDCNLNDFYCMIDYLLVSSSAEGGPIPFMEALRSGTLSIAPKIGVCDFFTSEIYELNNYKSLKEKILHLYEQKKSSRLFLTNQINKYTFRNFAEETRLVFEIIHRNFLKL